MNVLTKTITSIDGKKFVVYLDKSYSAVDIYIRSERTTKRPVFWSDMNRQERIVEIHDMKLMEVDLDGNFITRGAGNLSGRGIGKQIVRIFEEYVRTLGIRKIIGKISKEDADRGVDIFWKKQGYEINEYRGGDESIRFVMEKSLD